MNAVAISILTHYYMHDTAYQSNTGKGLAYSKAEKDAINWLKENDLLTSNHDLTPRGYMHIKFILGLDLPVSIWVPASEEAVSTWVPVSKVVK